MRASVLRAPGGYDRIEIENIPDPDPAEIRVALHASSLNYHDLLVAKGSLPTADGRVIMSDGAGVVEAPGASVTEFNRRPCSLLLLSAGGAMAVHRIRSVTTTRHPATATTGSRWNSPCVRSQPSHVRRKVGVILRPRRLRPQG